MTQTVSLDEYLSSRKTYVKSTACGDVVMKAYADAPASWNAEARSARFVMSAEIEDRDRDIVMQDGLDLDAFLKNPVALYAHNSWGLPVGKWADLQKVAGRPKRTEGSVFFDPEGTDEDTDAVAAKVAIGTLRMCSIGFIPRRIDRRPEEVGGGRYPGYNIIEAELVECSIVPIGSNPMALVKSAQGAERDAVLEMIERVLDTWERHPETGLIVPRARYEAAHKAATGEKTTVVVEPPKPDRTVSLRVETGEAIAALKEVQAEAEKTEGFLTRLGKAIGLVKEPAPKPAPPPALTAEQKAAILAEAQTVLGKTQTA